MIKLKITLKTVLSHQDPALKADTGNFTPLRKQTVVGVGEVPILSGNAVRGVLRRLLMHHFLACAGMTSNTYKDATGQWDRIYACLANGGTLTGAEKSVDTEMMRKLRAACPPLSLLGAALYTHMLPGMCSIFDAYPVCKEMADIGFCDETEVPLSSLYGERNHVRLTDAEIDKEQAEITPMPYTNEVFIPGTVLQSGILFDRTATEIEHDCAAWGVSKITQLGGNRAKGFGLVSIEPSEQIGDADRYEAWVKDHAAEAKPVIEAAIPRKAVK